MFRNPVLNRPWTPASHPGNYQTFRIAFGSDIVIKDACEQVGCEARRIGWTSTFDESTELGKAQATYVRHFSGRTFTERRTEAGLTVFIFEPGQRCFAEHKTTPNFFTVRAGDHRRNYGLLRRHTNGRDFAEDFALHQEALAEEFKRGSI